MAIKVDVTSKLELMYMNMLAQINLNDIILYRSPIIKYTTIFLYSNNLFKNKLKKLNKPLEYIIFSLFQIPASNKNKQNFRNAMQLMYIF